MSNELKLRGIMQNNLSILFQNVQITKEKEKVKNSLGSLYYIVSTFPFVFNNDFGRDILG